MSPSSFSSNFTQSSIKTPDHTFQNTKLNPVKRHQYPSIVNYAVKVELRGLLVIHNNDDSNLMPAARALQFRYVIFEQVG